MDRLIKLFPGSIWIRIPCNAPVEGKKEFIPEVTESFEANEELREEKRRRMEEKLARILSPEKINVYVKDMLGDRQVMAASEFPVSEGIPLSG